LNIHLVGCGALGAKLAKEIARRAKAQTLDSTQLFIYDDDTVADRNVYSQEFQPSDVGLFKADVTAHFCNQYIKTESIKARVDQASFRTIMKLDKNSIIVNGVDNVKSRVDMWYLGLVSGTPVMHMGMSQNGSGYIGWSYELTDFCQFSPANVDPEKLEELMKQPDPASLPPCMLNSFNGLISNTVMAALNSLFIFMGNDSEGILNELWGEDPKFTGVATTWNTTSYAFSFDKKLITINEWPKTNSVTAEEIK